MPARPRRRAVGPAGAHPPQPGPPDPHEELPDRARDTEHADDERLLADRPPHHDRGV